MARPRLTSSKKTSFGKRTEAEKSFKDKKKNKASRFEEDRPKGKGFFNKTSRFGGKPSFRKSEDGDARPTRSSRPFGKRDEGGSSRSFGSSSDRPKRFSSERPDRGGFSRGDDKPFRKSTRSFDGDKKPYGKREGDREERPFRKSSGFEKRPYRNEGEDKPFRKSTRSFDGDKKPFGKREGDREERPFRKSGGFEKRPYRSEGEDKPFRKSTRSVDGDKKPFGKREGDREERPFRKSSGFDKKPYGSEGEDKPFRKSTRSFDNDREGGEERPFKKRESRAFAASKLSDKPRKFSKNDVTKKGESRPEYKEKPQSDSELIRLNKFMANSGVGSRREADEMIKMGLVTVNGETVTEMGHKVKATDDVRYEGRKLKAEKPVYILLNKPKGFITTTDDPQERNTVMGIVANACKERVYPVGRLDRNTTGLLLLTNDGDLADKLTHPSYNVKKIYKVELDKAITKADVQKIADGVYLEEGKAVVDDIAVVSDDKKTVGVELHIGWNRIVRRIFESQGYEVVKLDRVAYAGLDKKDLNRGQWRFLKPEEVVTLKHFK